jgi:transcriptional regulator with XRE-family HTH domain
VDAPSAGRRPSLTTDPHDLDRTYLQQFGLHLKLLRVKCGLSQEQVAERAGMHRTFVGLLERGESGISVERLPDLAEALDVAPAELLPPSSSGSR